MIVSSCCGAAIVENTDLCSECLEHCTSVNEVEEGEDEKGDSIMERCANTEALARYERECEKNEKAYEYKEACMFGELDEAIEMIIEIVNRYEMRENGVEYVTDKI